MTRKRNLFDLKKEYCAPDTLMRIARLQRTIHVSNDNSSAIVIPIIRVECTTHRNCSHIFHNCLQRNIGSCGNGQLHYD